MHYPPIKQDFSTAHSFAKNVVIQTFSGAAAGVIEICAMHPLDVIKTRLQIQSSASKIKYNGLIDCVHKIYKLEGLSSFYKGLIPPILMETPRKAVMFLTFEQYKNLFAWHDVSHPSVLVYFLAGAAAGASDSLVSNPFEVVKVTLQSQIGKNKKSVFDTAKQILNQGGFGLKGLNKGLDAIIFRNALFSSAYFGVYNSILKLSNPMDTKNKEFVRKVAISTLSGIVGTCLVTPSDVVKSKIQGRQPNPPAVKYQYLVPAFRDVYKETGWRGLYKGFVPKVLRLGPGGAILMLIYESVSNKLYMMV